MANWQIPITENGKATLATAGKYCDRNIDINVDVEGEVGGAYDITATINADGTQSLAIVDSGSGGVEAAMETVTLNIVNNGIGFSVTYYTADQTLADVEVISSVKIDVAKNSFLAFYGPYLALNIESGCIYEYGPVAGCYVAANSGTVTNEYAA